MGKNNRARRAAKAKKRASGRSGTGRTSGQGSQGGWFGSPGDEPLFNAEERAMSLWTMLARGDTGGREQHDLYNRLANTDSAAVNGSAERLLVTQTGVCWNAGWQPVELVREGRRSTSSAAAGRLVKWAIAVDNANRRANTIDPRWQRQIDTLDLPEVNGRSGWLSAWASAEALDTEVMLRAVADALHAVFWVPRLDVLIPPPGSTEARQGWSAAATASDHVDADPVLDRIRALLAKAESTEFEAEATAFTAKAQELMTRHAIDVAMLARERTGSGVEPTMIRVLIDAPYVDAKSLLLHVVADSGRCRSVVHSTLDMCSVMGLPDDLVTVEMLFTSLLVQAQSALADAARRAPAGTRVRSQSYRSAFLVGFANRIGDRLKAINEHVYESAEAELGSSFQLVLRENSEAVNEAFEKRFSELTEVGVRGGYDAAGYNSGRTAADRAQLNLDLTDAAEAQRSGGDAASAPMPAASLFD